VFLHKSLFLGHFRIAHIRDSAIQAAKRHFLFLWGWRRTYLGLI
jgi:hypothetical protein